MVLTVTTSSSSTHMNWWPGTPVLQTSTGVLLFLLLSIVAEFLPLLFFVGSLGSLSVTVSTAVRQFSVGFLLVNQTKICTSAAGMVKSVVSSSFVLSGAVTCCSVSPSNVLLRGTISPFSSST